MVIISLIGAVDNFINCRFGMAISCVVSLILNVLVICGVDLMSSHKWIIYCMNTFESFAIFGSGDVKEINSEKENI